MMLRVPAQCIVAPGKALKGSAILCTVIFLPRSQPSQILTSHSTYRLASSPLKYLEGELSQQEYSVIGSNCMNQADYLLRKWNIK